MPDLDRQQLCWMDKWHHQPVPQSGLHPHMQLWQHTTAIFWTGWFLTGLCLWWLAEWSSASWRSLYVHGLPSLPHESGKKHNTTTNSLMVSPPKPSSATCARMHINDGDTLFKPARLDEKFCLACDHKNHTTPDLKIYLTKGHMLPFLPSSRLHLNGSCQPCTRVTCEAYQVNKCYWDWNCPTSESTTI